MTEKQLLRKKISSLKQQYSAPQLALFSSNAISRLEQHPLFQAAHTVLLYHSLPDEVDTHDLILRHAGLKHILLPVVDGSDLRLRPYTGQEHTERGAFGIVEPQGNDFTDYPAIQLAVIPGIAFDADGHRLGRGRGYYDRLLPKLQCPLIGLCFPFQLLPQIPTEPHDRPVYYVIS